MRQFLCVLAALLSSAPANAEWYRASSRHFIIYSEQKPNKLREFAENLEKFDVAVRQVRGMDDLPPSEGNRVTIFSVPDAKEVQRLIGDKNGFIDGFYKGSAAGSVAFVSRGNKEVYRYSQTGSHFTSKVEYGIDDDALLYHEYAHHLMMQDLVSPVPNWYVEGFAEFMSTAKMENDGSVGLGLPATHRYAGLLQGQQLSTDQLVAIDYQPKTNEELESLYGKGWLLTHFLTFAPERKGQLNTYLRAIAQDVPAAEAAKKAFGDLAQLDRDLDKYLHQSKLRYLTIAKEAFPATNIDIQALGPTADSVLPLLIEVRNGLDEANAQTFLARAQEVSGRSPENALAQTTLAEIALDAKRPEVAEAAAIHILAAKPRDLDATILLGRAIAQQAEKLEDAPRHAMFERARKTFSAANAIDKEDPEPLMEFYMAFAHEGLAPNTNAIAALHYASELAPQDQTLRINSALRFLYDNKLDDAKRALVVLAFDPHGGKDAAYAKSIFTAISAGDRDRAMKLAQAGTGPGKD